MPLRFGRVAKTTQDELDAPIIGPVAPDIEALEIRLPDLSRVALEPGDAILVRTQRELLSEHQAAQIKARIADRLPGHEVLVIAAGTELAVLRPVVDELRRKYEEAIQRNSQPTVLPPSTVHVPDAAGLRGRIMVMINEATSDPGHRMSLPMVALGNEIWHTVVAHLAEHGVELGMPREVEQSVRWKGQR